MSVRTTPTTGPLTEGLVQDILYRRLRDKYELMVPNAFVSQWAEADMIAVTKSRYLHEFEVKLTLSDFWADVNKTVVVEGACRSKHDLLAQGRAPLRAFWYVTPVGLLTPVEIPSWAGLLEVAPMGSMRTVKAAPTLPGQKADDAAMYLLARKLAYRFWSARVSEPCN